MKITTNGIRHHKDETRHKKERQWSWNHNNKNSYTNHRGNNYKIKGHQCIVGKTLRDLHMWNEILFKWVMKKILKETIANKILNWIMTEDPQTIDRTAKLHRETICSNVMMQQKALKHPKKDEILQMRHQARVTIVLRNRNGDSTPPPKYCEQTVAHCNAAYSRVIGSFKTRKKSLATQKLENLQKNIEGILSDGRKTTQNGNIYCQKEGSELERGSCVDKPGIISSFQFSQNNFNKN